MKLELDGWQKQVLEAKGNICLCSGRQVGKSTIISMKAGEFAVRNMKKTILIIASTERQAYLLFEKTLAYIYENFKSYIKKGKDKPTKHTIRLTNGSVIHCLPTGMTGYGIRGYTIDMLLADEAHFIPEDVWSAVTPMLATTKGTIILLSTPHGREGYFFRCFSDQSFSQFHVSSEDCPRIDRNFLAREKERMSKREYAQEYLGQFVDDLMQFFPDKLIIQSMNALRGGISPEKRYYIGIDVARRGGDETTFEIVEKNGEALIHAESIIEKNLLLPVIAEKIKSLHERYSFRKIYIDDGGMGVGVFDMLFEEPKFKTRLVAINNASRSIEERREGDPRKKRLLKEDLYNNLLRLMEQQKIKLLNDSEIFQSMKSVQYEYTDKGNLRIFGNYTHIVEGLIRAAWCVKDKSLNIWVRWSEHGKIQR